MRPALRNNDRRGGVGVFQFDPQLAKLTFKMEGSSQVPAALVDQEILMDGSFVYSPVPPCPTGAFGAKPWVRYDSAAGLDPTSVTSSDPTAVLEALRGAGKVEEVGNEKVRGSSTTHYKVTLDLDKALEKVSEDRREAVKAIFASLSDKGLDFDVWIDDEDLRPGDPVLPSSGPGAGGY